MENKKLVIEIGIEEIPAQYIKIMAKSYEENAKKMFDELDIAYSSLQVLYTPRRLALIAENVGTVQNDKLIYVKGPHKSFAFQQDGQPSKALLGFLNKNNKQLEDVVFRDDYVFLSYVDKGQSTLSILSSRIEKLILSIYNPNPMRWNRFKIKFIRPIRWIFAMFGNELIPVHLECVDSDKFTMGHRTLCDRKVQINDVSEYVEKLRDAYVILDQNKRKQMIVNQIKELEQKNDFEVELDENLLEEINNILEYPTCAVGMFDKKYLVLPECIIKSPLKEQQRYFAVYKKGQLLNYFVFVRNGGEQFLDNVIKGNERVLCPRLEDAKFFFENDLKTSLKEKSEQLSEVIFVEKVGSYAHKNVRVKKIAKQLFHYLKYNVSEEDIATTTKLMKADLITSVVREYTNIQGEIGAILAKREGYSDEICTAIKEQYLPNFQGDSLPSTEFSAVISMADKLDTILSLCAIGLKPTGSSDPYGLRRQILGIYLISLDQKFDIDFDKVIEKCADNYTKFLENETEEDFVTFIKDFFYQRLKVFLNEVKNYKQDELSQVSLSELNIYASIKKLDTIREIRNSDWFNEFISIYNRILKLIKNFDCKNIAFSDDIKDDEAQEMFKVFYLNKSNILKNINKKEYESAIKTIALCGKSINDFMTNNLALCDDTNKRNNRVAFFYEFCSICSLILTL